MSLQVTAVDRDSSALCGSVNDPHMTTFDGAKYNNFFEGEFLLYRSQTYSTEVNSVLFPIWVSTIFILTISAVILCYLCALCHWLSILLSLKDTWGIFNVRSDLCCAHEGEMGTSYTIVDWRTEKQSFTLSERPGNEATVPVFTRSPVQLAKHSAMPPTSPLLVCICMHIQNLIHSSVCVYVCGWCMVWVSENVCV